MDQARSCGREKIHIDAGKAIILQESLDLSSQCISNLLPAEGIHPVHCGDDSYHMALPEGKHIGKRNTLSMSNPPAIAKERSN
jgi:hypothetical protein